LGDLFHGCAGQTAPLSKALLEEISREELVLADETPIRVQAKGKTRRAFLWTFRAKKLVGYRFSPTRSGETPKQVLGKTKGKLLVDAYSGYNQVTTP